MAKKRVTKKQKREESNYGHMYETKGVGSTPKARELDKQRKLRTIPNPRSKSNKKRGIHGVHQLKNSQKGTKTYGWIEDHGHPDHVVVKQRMVADNPDGQSEHVHFRENLESGRPDGGFRIDDRAQYNDNYDEIFGERKRGIAKGYRKTKKKY